MSFPSALRNSHVRKYSLETGFLRTAGVNPEPDLPCTFPHMTYAHLGKAFAVPGTLDTIIVLPAAEPIPHRLYIRRDRCRGPIRITVVCHDRTKVLKGFILILHGTFQPVFGIQVHHNAALVEAMMALGEIRFHNEREILFFLFHTEAQVRYHYENDNTSAARDPYEALL